MSTKSRFRGNQHSYVNYNFPGHCILRHAWFRLLAPYMVWIHDVTQRRQQKSHGHEQDAQKFGEVWFSNYASVQTNRHTYHSTFHPSQARSYNIFILHPKIRCCVLYLPYLWLPVYAKLFLNSVVVIHEGTDMRRDSRSHVSVCRWQKCVQGQIAVQSQSVVGVDCSSPTGTPIEARHSTARYSSFSIFTKHHHVYLSLSSRIPHISHCIISVLGQSTHVYF